MSGIEMDFKIINSNICAHIGKADLDIIHYSCSQLLPIKQNHEAEFIATLFCKVYDTFILTGTGMYYLQQCSCTYSVCFYTSLA